MEGQKMKGKTEGKKAIYINRIGNGYRETVDEFDSRREARKMVSEYTFGDPAGRYYVSTRCCANWKEEG